MYIVWRVYLWGVWLQNINKAFDYVPGVSGEGVVKVVFYVYNYW